MITGAEFVVPYCIKVTLITRQISEAAREVQVQAISDICSFGMHLLHEGDSWWPHPAIHVFDWLKSHFFCFLVLISAAAMLFPCIVVGQSLFSALSVIAAARFALSISMHPMPRWHCDVFQSVARHDAFRGNVTKHTPEIASSHSVEPANVACPPSLGSTRGAPDPGIRQADVKCRCDRPYVRMSMRRPATRCGPGPRTPRRRARSRASRTHRSRVLL